jgi:hypothetical protein
MGHVQTVHKCSSLLKCMPLSMGCTTTLNSLFSPGHTDWAEDVVVNMTIHAAAMLRVKIGYGNCAQGACRPGHGHANAARLSPVQGPNGLRRTSSGARALCSWEPGGVSLLQHVNLRSGSAIMASIAKNLEIIRAPRRPPASASPHLL